MARAADADIPIIYVNDNYGDWNSSASELAEKAIEGAHPELVKPVLPPYRHSFVIKARHSIFYGTPLEYSTGIAVIVAAYNQLAEEGRQIAVYGASSQVLRVLSITGLTANGLLFESAEQALSASTGAG